MNTPAKSEAKPTNDAHSHVKSATHNHDFSAIMTEVTSDMPRYKRYFSKLIHLRIIWLISDILSKTIARPNAILFGAILSFAVTAGTYFLSKNFGYSLSGFESIGAFLFGWLVGILFDVISLPVKRRR